MANSDPFVVTSFKISAKIGDVNFTDVISFSASFALNAIPVATMTVATGRKIGSNEKATIHRRRDDLKPGDVAVVTLTITNHDGATGKMESGKYVIFRGKYAGIGYQRGHQYANYTIQLIHWLDDINQGSMVNGNWFPGAPYDLAQNAGYYSLSLREGNSGFGPIPSVDVNNEFINYTNISTDLWDAVISPVFDRIAHYPLPRYQDDTQAASDAQRKPILDALARMGASGPGGAYYKPLALNLEGLSAANTAWGVKEALLKDAGASFAYTTFWNKLVGEYAPQFYFAISPSAEFALPIPFFAGLNTPYKLIMADEYNYAAFNASVIQQLESVDVFYSANGDSGYGIGARTDGQPSPSFREPLGFYPPGNVQNKRGFKMLKEPPTWMANITPSPIFSPATTATAGSRKDSTSPSGGTRTTPGNYYTAPRYTLAQQASAVATKFAEHWYKTEVLYQRHGEMSGKLRFDIAPGSIVAIETPAADLDKPDILFATATQVSYAIDAERGAAGTSFTLAHIRTGAENDSEYLTSSTPPLYKTAWKGAPLAIRS